MEFEISCELIVCILRPTARVMGSSSRTGYHRRLAKLQSVLASAWGERGRQGQEQGEEPQPCVRRQAGHTLKPYAPQSC